MQRIIFCQFSWAQMIALLVRQPAAFTTPRLPNTHLLLAFAGAQVLLS